MPGSVLNTLILCGDPAVGTCPSLTAELAEAGSAKDTAHNHCWGLDLHPKL